jgi:hypothetical protein
VNWVTVIASALLAGAPAFIAAIPPAYGGPLSGLIAGAAAMYHLYRASPNAPPARPAQPGSWDR